MIAILTGDIINSRSQKSPETWLKPFKEFLNKHVGQSPQSWEIFRGDSFQLMVPPQMALRVALHIKAILRSLGNTDARISIGLGNQTFSGESISESSGIAHVNSGEQFEEIKSTKQNLVIRSPWPDFDEEMNLFFRFLAIVMENWSEVAAETASLIWNEKSLSQVDLARRLGISQPSVSARYNRARLEEIQELLSYFEKRVNQLKSAE